MSRLTEIIQTGKSLNLEFKDRFSAAVIEPLAAFANSKGGAVYIGIGEDSSSVGSDVKIGDFKTSQVRLLVQRRTSIRRVSYGNKKSIKRHMKLRAK
jgi:predicted HTH transcriptional regulator